MSGEAIVAKQKKKKTWFLFSTPLFSRPGVSDTSRKNPYLGILR